MDTSFGLDFGPENGGERKFSSGNAFLRWLDEERAAWDWLVHASLRDPNANHAKTTMSNTWHELEKRGKQAVNAAESGDDVSFSRTVDALRNEVVRFYHPPCAISRWNSKAKFLDDVKDIDLDSAVCALAHFIDTAANPGTRAYVQGGAWAVLFANGGRRTARAERKRLEKLGQDWAANLASAREKSEQLLSQMSARRDEIASQSEEQLQRSEQARADQAHEFKELLERSRERIGELEETYNQKLSLAAPVQYWKDLATRHQRQKWWALGIAAIVAGLSVWGLVREAKGLLPEAGSSPEWWRVMLLLASATLAIWLVRLFVKIFLSSHHLQTDAVERSVVMQAYLALLKEGNGLQDSERHLVLSTVFRPSSTGIVKDDGAPPGLAEILSRFLPFR